MATLTTNYGTSTAITCAVASLASSAGFTGGYESDQIDNTSNKFVGALLEGFITTGTSPTVNTNIRVYVWGAAVSLATTAKDVLDGTGSTETLTVADPEFMQLIANITVTATSNVRYDFGQVNIAQCFGGVMPQFWGVFVSHNTGVNLNSTAGNHSFSYTGIKYDVA